VYSAGGHASFAKRLTGNELSDFSVLCDTDCVEQASGDNMWTEITRRKYDRAVQRYASNLSDAEWAFIEPFMPVRKVLGRPREKTDLRAVVDAILYIRAERLPMADATKRLSALHDSARVFL